MDKVYVVYVIEDNGADAWEIPKYVAHTKTEAIQAQMHLEKLAADWKHWRKQYYTALNYRRTDLLDQWAKDNPSPPGDDLSSIDDVGYREVPLWMTS